MIRLNNARWADSSSCLTLFGRDIGIPRSWNHLYHVLQVSSPVVVTEMLECGLNAIASKMVVYASPILVITISRHRLCHDLN